MTSRRERAERGAWWKRQRLGSYLPPTAFRARKLGDAAAAPADDQSEGAGVETNPPNHTIVVR
jgi:hypothetical protein